MIASKYEDSQQAFVLKLVTSSNQEDSVTSQSSGSALRRDSYIARAVDELKQFQNHGMNTGMPIYNAVEITSSNLPVAKIETKETRSRRWSRRSWQVGGVEHSLDWSK
jgi:hypothetical protein